MKTKLLTRFVALVMALAVMIPFTTISAYAIEDKDTVSVGEVVEALYALDGEQPMIKEIHNDKDGVYATYEKNATSWAYAYDILSEDDDMDADITQEELAEILYHYAKHHDVDVSRNSQLNANDWAVSYNLIPVDSNGNLYEDTAVTPSELSAVLANYAAVDLPKVGVVADGLTLILPSEINSTINPLCDFYVIGDIDPSVTVPDNAHLSVQLKNSSGDLLRDVFTTIKDNQQGMYVDYPGISISSGSRESFRGSMMPDLVYDPNFPESFGYTWIKAYYTDEHYTSLIYGGAYRDDIYPYDQYYNKLEPLPEGDYEIAVRLVSGAEILASLSAQITIGVVPEKVISRFTPASYLDRVKEYAAEQGYTLYIDPFAGAWNLPYFTPQWKMNYVGYIDPRWRLVDRMCYTGGMTYFFNYNTAATSTSYSVELGQIGYLRNLDNPNNLTYVYWDIGEPEIIQQGRLYMGQFVEKNTSEMGNVVFTRADYSAIATPENTITPTILNETTSVFDLSQTFTVTTGDIVSLNGLCRQIQPEQVILNEDQTITMGNRIASVRYTLTLGTGEVYQVVDKDVSLTRTMANGSTVTSILEFRHNFSIDESLRGNYVRVFAQPIDKFGNDVGEQLYVCEFYVSRS